MVQVSMTENNKYDGTFYYETHVPADMHATTLRPPPTSSHTHAYTNTWIRKQAKTYVAHTQPHVSNDVPHALIITYSYRRRSRCWWSCAAATRTTAGC